MISQYFTRWIVPLLLSTRQRQSNINVSFKDKLPAMRRATLCDSKTACGSGVVRVQPSDAGTLILVDQFGLENFERGEIVSPEEALLGKNPATPDARHRRPLKFFYTIQV